MQMAQTKLLEVYVVLCAYIRSNVFCWCRWHTFRFYAYNTGILILCSFPSRNMKPIPKNFASCAYFAENWMYRMLVAKCYCCYHYSYNSPFHATNWYMASILHFSGWKYSIYNFLMMMNSIFPFLKALLFCDRKKYF